MEDGPEGLSSAALTNNGELHSVMANFPEVEVEKSTAEVNGKSVAEICATQNTDSSDCDALVIDETVKPKKAKLILKKDGFRGFEKSENYTATKIISAILKDRLKTELQVQKASGVAPVSKSEFVKAKKPGNKKSANPQLREYAQYLGLQPTVQFKCSRCALSGFQSLGSLNEHRIHCNSRSPIPQPVFSHSNVPSTNIRVTRKVFLCSACGTYYENWNLFLHMREVHRRFICLYCLGMFSHSDKLSLHLVSKHNCTPSKINTAEDFFNIYKDPCFLMCCECEKVFTERDNFFNHTCVDTAKPELKANSSAAIINKPLITPSTNIEDGNNENTGNKSDFLEKEVPSEGTTLDSTGLESPEVAMETYREIETIQSPDDILNNTEMNDNEELSENSHTRDSIASPLSVDEKMDLLTESESFIQKQEPEQEDNCAMTAIDQSNGADESEKVQEDEHVQEIKEEIPDNETLVESVENEKSVHEQQQDRVSENSDELRRVPKVTLKLPKQLSYNEEDKDFSDDSEKLTMEVDQVESESEMIQENVDTSIQEEEEEEPHDKSDSSLQIAGVDIPVTELELEQPLDKFESRILVQKCLQATILSCAYCNHARKIAVNGKQLALHAIAEHRFSAIVNSITAEELIPESFVSRLKESFVELDAAFFNLEASEDAITFSHIFECFQCRFTTTVHKELYLHNRKMHAKSILLCIMCKSNFYSYSELICHLCPGVYIDLNKDISFRCCLCVSGELPSAFRLMVHLRKKHHACDVCLELCHNQSRLSNHVWKHKLHHLCYRCGIAYRNKPDITKHLFWKHGTESLLCKKCLQKKWPHVYHFCIPPTSFVCEECNLSFQRSMSLRVHKRLHTDERPHCCTFETCTEKFISKKLLMKHDFKHREPTEVAVKIESKEELKEDIKKEVEEVDNAEGKATQSEVENPDEKLEKPKPKVDVYDLPALNLSESDTSDSEDESTKKVDDTQETDLQPETQPDAEKTAEDDLEKPVPIVLENIWDDFKNYQAKTKEKMENVATEEPEVDVPSIAVIMRDHDYCIRTTDELIEQKPEVDLSVDHDYCTQPTAETSTAAAPTSSPKKKRAGSSSDSSSDSDSSSCTCGSNCSCSSSSGSSSSSSDSSESDSSTSEGRRRQQARRERRKAKVRTKGKETEHVDVTATENPPQSQLDVPIHESDLETTESDTDEEFYDKHPQKMASKFIEEKRNQLMLLAGIGPCINGSALESSRPVTPSLPEAEMKSKKKAKNKKRKKKKSSKYDNEITQNPKISTSEYQYYHHPQTVAPITLSLKNSPMSTPAFNSPIHSSLAMNMSDADSSLRASKRRRVPNKFYGYSSDEDGEKMQHQGVLKWRKVDLPSPRSPMVIPPITIKTVQPPPPPTPTVEPISIRATSTPGEMRVQHVRPPPLVQHPAFKPRPQEASPDSGTDSNESSADEKPPIKEQPALYCYCRCPYDEVSEMIGCDSSDCSIEWFHFECVGIMVPPKGQWFCPDCRKKKQQKRELLQQTSLL